MARSKGSAVKKIAVGAGIAAAAGYVAGVLTAPKSGKATRAEIKDVTNKGVDKVEKQLSKLHDDLGATLEDAKKKAGDMSGKTRKELDKLVDTAKDSKDKVSGLVQAVKKGGKKDKDLKKAMSDANKAIEHLRDYLSK